MANILIVDDEVLTTEMLTAFLDLIGHRSVQTHSAQEMWSKLHFMQPDVILLDIQLPDGNGLELCQQIRQKPEMARIPIIIISAHAPPLHYQAADMGADAYLVKPISMQTLLDVLSSVGVVDRRRAGS